MKEELYEAAVEAIACGGMDAVLHAYLDLSICTSEGVTTIRELCQESYKRIKKRDGIKYRFPKYRKLGSMKIHEPAQHLYSHAQTKEMIRMINALVDRSDDMLDLLENLVGDQNGN